MSKRKAKVAVEEKFKIPGQKCKTPDKMDTLRLFYSSLFEEQRLKSKMATNWMMKYGLLSLVLVKKVQAGIATDADVVKEFPPRLECHR